MCVCSFVRSFSSCVLKKFAKVLSMTILSVCSMFNVEQQPDEDGRT